LLSLLPLAPLFSLFLSLMGVHSMPLKGDILEDPASEPREDMYMLTVDPEKAPNEPE
jgi:argininosuccinate synthase